MKNNYRKILEDIKKIKIQGATDTTKAAIQAFLSKPKEISAERAASEIIKTRPTEPLMQHAVIYLLKSRDSKKAAAKFLTYLKKSEDKIASYGANIIKNNMNIYSHCHSTSVISILKKAKKQKKNFTVYTTEVEPLLQGRKTAKELAKAGIKIVVYPDLAAEHALSKCDILLFGSDAYMKKGQANKIGTSLLCEIAKEHKIPRYSAGISLKYTKKIKLELRKGSEVWDEREKNIHVENPAFDFIDKKLISSVVSEFGILPYKKFIKQARKNIKNFQ